VPSLCTHICTSLSSESRKLRFGGIRARRPRFEVRSGERPALASFLQSALRLLRTIQVSTQFFESGAALARARPVLTFATELRSAENGPKAVSEAPPRVVRRDVLLGTAAVLPIIPRIVRRGTFDRAGGRLLVLGVALAAIGVTAAAFGVRSVLEPAVPAGLAASAYDAQATEHPLSRGAAAGRVERLDIPAVKSLPFPAPSLRGGPKHPMPPPAPRANVMMRQDARNLNGRPAPMRR
jgi:hypothetical protein